jgi:hypothetical protein
MAIEEPWPDEDAGTLLHPVRAALETPRRALIKLRGQNAENRFSHPPTGCCRANEESRVYRSVSVCYYALCEKQIKQMQVFPFAAPAVRERACRALIKTPPEHPPWGCAREDAQRRSALRC